MLVSLGCEKLQPSRLLGNDLPILGEGNVIRLQDQRGFAETVAAIMEGAERRLAQLDRRRRVTCPASDLIVGLQCGGSDGLSGVTCNPAVGFAADLLVRAGATVMFSEVTEVRDAIHLLTARAADREVALALVREMRWYDEYLARGSADRSANPTPGNKRGGLANVVENALHAMPGTGEIVVDAAVDDGSVVIKVRDTGVGMDEEALARVFEPYFSTKTSGTGLGLPIARRNIELSGGAIEVQSAKGAGTTVTVRLPGAAQALTKPSGSAAASTPSQ